MKFFLSGKELLFLGAGLVLFAAAPPANASLIIYYSLDELSGNVANDLASVGGVQNATAAVPASDWQPAGGVLGGALRFSPTAQADVDEALSFSSGTPILSGLPFTLSVWLNTTDTTNRNHAALYFGNSAANDQYYAVGTPGTGDGSACRAEYNRGQHSGSGARKRRCVAPRRGGFFVHQ